MTVAVQHDARGETILELTPDFALSARQRVAWRDLGEAASLWRLCWTLSWLDIKLRYRGSMLGPFWLTLSTAIMVGSMGLIYSTLFRMNLREYLPFLAASQVLWGFLSTTVGDAGFCYTQAEGTIRSMRMPYSLFAARVVLRNLFVLGHNLVVIVGVDLLLSTWPGVRAVLAVPGTALWLVDMFAATVLLGAVCTRFRDIPPIVGSVMQMAFFVTPVIWKPELMGNGARWLPLNPFYSLLEVVRGPLLGSVPTLATYAAALVWSALLCGGAWLVFARVRGRIAFWV